jgi:TusE/DsrC/DsvC family sulfur relay protein
MPTLTYAGSDVTVNDEGFFTDPAQWTQDMVPQIAAREGIPELTDRHWQVIKFMRHEYEAKGAGLFMANGARAEGIEASP